jgi:hypothetical protein
VVSPPKLSLEARHHFDPTLWKSIPLLAAPASTLLVTWTLEPEPVDGGMPPSVQAPFASALCALGIVFYAADAEAETAATKIAEVQVRSGLRRRLLMLFRAQSESEVLPAFESGTHDWSLNAQWLMVADPAVFQATQQLDALTRTLYQERRLPDPWPEGVLLIVQAGVDGDAAICHCQNRHIDERFCSLLGDSARAVGAGFQLLD